MVFIGPRSEAGSAQRELSVTKYKFALLPCGKIRTLSLTFALFLTPSTNVETLYYGFFEE